MSTFTIQLKNLTSLPLQVVEVGNRILPDVLITTPHKGKITLALKEEHYALFGSPSQMEKHLPQIMHEIYELERDAKDYLLEQWKDSLTSKSNE